MTLELALAGVPMVTAYRTGAMEAWILRRAIKVNSVILANLVAGENVVPEFLQRDCTPEKLSQALRDVLSDTPLRRQQLEAFAKIDKHHVDGQSVAQRTGAPISCWQTDAERRGRSTKRVRMRRSHPRSRG